MYHMLTTGSDAPALTHVFVDYKYNWSTTRVSPEPLQAVWCNDVTQSCIAREREQNDGGYINFDTFAGRLCAQRKTVGSSRAAYQRYRFLERLQLRCPYLDLGRLVAPHEDAD